jgi:hypothetical protein
MMRKNARVWERRKDLQSGGGWLWIMTNDDVTVDLISK